jgi:hypothetical protein
LGRVFGTPPYIAYIHNIIQYIFTFYFIIVTVLIIIVIIIIITIITITIIIIIMFIIFIIANTKTIKLRLNKYLIPSCAFWGDTSPGDKMLRNISPQPWELPDIYQRQCNRIAGTEVEEDLLGASPRLVPAKGL